MTDFTLRLPEPEETPAGLILPESALPVPAEEPQADLILTDAAEESPAELILPESALPIPTEEPPTDLIPNDTEAVPAADLLLPADGPAEAPQAGLILPETALPSAPAEDADAFCVTFAGQECHSLAELASVMVDAWGEARTALLNGTLAEALDGADLAAAAICREQAAAVAAGRFTPDRGLLEAIRRLSGQPLVVWRGRRYASAEDLGGSMLQALRGTGAVPAHVDSLMVSGAAAVFAAPAQKEGLAAIGARCAAPDCSMREKTLLTYMTGYLLSGVAAFVMEGETFYTVEDLGAWLENRCKRSPAAFTRACHRLLDESNQLDPQLEAWLIALGRRQDVAKWQSEMDAGML